MKTFFSIISMIGMIGLIALSIGIFQDVFNENPVSNIDRFILFTTTLMIGSIGYQLSNRK